MTSEGDTSSETYSETSLTSLTNLTSNCCKICDPKCKYNDCICSEDWKNFDKILQDIKKISPDILLESLRISTITLCFNLNSNINVEQLIKKYPYKNNGKFYNSYIFNWHTKYQLKKTVSVKIFPNGKAQIAGLSTIKSCAYIIRKIFNKIKPFFFSDSAKISDVNIVMINSDFKIMNTLNLINFCDILSNNTIQSNGNFLNIVYQPTKYPAINSKFICNKYLEDYYHHNYKYGFKKKFTKCISILIFRSGSIIVTGGNNINDYLETYNYILNFIQKHSDLVIIK